MNKSLETEYKEAVRAEIPDLWGKIEAKLDAQDAENKKKNVVEFPKTVTSAQNDNIKKAFAETPVVSAEKKTEPVKRRKKIRWQYFGVAAAAALCLLVGIPAMSNMKNAASTAPAMSEATANCASDGSSQAMESPVVAAEAQPQEASDEPVEAAAEQQEKAVNVVAGVQNAETNSVRGADSSMTYAREQDLSVSEGYLDGAATQTTVPGMGATTAGNADEIEEEDTDPQNVKTVGDADILVLLATDAGTTEEKMEQLTKELIKAVDPDLTLTLLDKEDAEYADYVDPQNDRISYLIVMKGDLTDEEILEQIEFLWVELKKYDFITVRDVQHRELAPY